MAKLDDIRQRDQAWDPHGAVSSPQGANRAAHDRRLLLQVIDALVLEHAAHAQRLVGILK